MNSSNVLFTNKEAEGDFSDVESINSDYLPDSGKREEEVVKTESVEEPVGGPVGEETVEVEEKLPEHACAYCGIHNPSLVVKCETCSKWFCNSSAHTSGSHIVTHLVMARHHTVALHPDSDLGGETLECYSCGSKNVFLLGFVTMKANTVVVMLCRIPCAQSRSLEVDATKWEALIENRALLSWIAAVPSAAETAKARHVTPEQIRKVETQWRMNRDATIKDVEEEAEEETVEPILIKYTDAYQYQESFSPLVSLEAEYDRQLKESQALEHVSVKWSLSLGKRHLAAFALSTFESNELKVAVGDEMVLRYSGPDEDAWEGHGFIVRLPSAGQEEFTLELEPSKTAPPTHLSSSFTAEFVWKGITYSRMQDALKTFAIVEDAVTPYIYHTVLGHDVAPVEFKAELPQDLSVPELARLNSSQNNAVKSVLQRPLSLIQGPPGTGKTVTSATIVYHLSRITKQRVLVCAPSNVAVDHLAEKLGAAGLKVVRIAAKSREDVDSSVLGLSLHNIVRNKATGELKKLFRLKEELGELSSKDKSKYLRLLRKQEHKELASVDVICTTCVGAGDKRLANFKFPVVLIDESTQASEPESLIPIVKSAKQVVLVGDHQQLGPVILEKRAANAGLKQSLFERLVILGHIPIRLEVQYRMHPCLSEFPSNMFYEGLLQNGVSGHDRVIANSFPWPIRDTPMMFWANYGREEISGSGTSFLNRVEAINCEKLITRLFLDGIKPAQIGVITPYEGQRAYVVQYMAMSGSLDKSLYAQVEVASVDAFQGREKDYIILSCVRANDAQSIGFLSDPRRLNVALTRAKYGLIVVGNPRALSKNLLWNHLLRSYLESGCLVEGPLDNLQISSIQLPPIRRHKQSRFKKSNPLSNPNGSSSNISSNFFNLASPGFAAFSANDFDSAFAPANLDGHSSSIFQSIWPSLSTSSNTPPSNSYNQSQPFSASQSDRLKNGNSFPKELKNVTNAFAGL